jgi:hypothetical protein
MNIIKRLRRLGAVLAGLGVAMAALASAAQASTAMFPLPGNGGPGGGEASDPSPVTRTVVVGGMPGWQIALIAVAAAIVAAGTALLIERTRSARRRLITVPA